MSSTVAWSRTRPVVAGRQAAVASAHPLATQAGIDILRRGGNAVDAAVATAVALGVVEPYMSGPAGVGFLLLHLAGGRPQTLNFSGNTPAGATPDKFDPQSQERGPRSSLIPGNVAGWLEALDRHGMLPAETVFAPAIELAEGGFPLHPFNVVMVQKAIERVNGPGLEIYGPLPKRVGAMLRQPDLAHSLTKIAAEGADIFYQGDLGRRIADFVQAEGGLLTRDDLARYRPEWQTPIDAEYRGLTVRTCPPNNEGFQILETLKLLEGYDLAGLGHNTAGYVHLLSEAIKLATADRIRWGGDPKFVDIPLERLLSQRYAAARRTLINRDRASRSEGERWVGKPAAGVVPPGSVDGLTTHLAVVDGQGNVASITQSLGNVFGSGLFVPGTGIALNNFAYWCEIDPSCPTPNLIQPGRRWSSCMAPVHVLQKNQFWFSIATPGSYGILQTTLQMLLNVVEFGADVQAAIEAPRFRVWEETRMQVEDRFSPAVRAELESLGHTLELVGDYSNLVGGGQAVMIDAESGARLAGADPRRDGYAMAY